MKFDVLHNFISPVTGHILADPNYVPYGNRQGIAVPSPIIIDIRLELNNLRKRYNILSEADFIVGHENSELPNAQVLYNLQDGYVFNTQGTVSTLPAIPPIPLCYAASTANLLFSYLNGASGVGATLTATSLGAFTLDGTSPPLNSYVLIKDQTTTFQNGIYIVTTVGGLVDYTVLTRSPTYDTVGEIHRGNIVAVEFGTVNAQTLWVETQDVTLIGTDPILFIPFTLFNSLPANNIWIGNNLNQPIPHPTIFLNNLPNLTTEFIWRGDKNNRPFESDSLTEAEKNIGTLFTDVNSLLQSLRDLSTIVNNLANTVATLKNIIDGIGEGISYVVLVATVAVLEVQVLNNRGDIDRLKESLGKYYQQALITPDPENILEYVIDQLITNLNGLGDYVRNLTVNALSIVGDVNFNNFKIINLGNPTLPTDGVNKYYVDLLDVAGTPGQIISIRTLVTETGPNAFTLSLAPTGVTAGSYTYTALTVDAEGRITSAANGDNTITLIGPVTGTGILGTPITTTFTLNLNEISVLNLGTGNIDANNFRIINLADPINPLDAVNLETLQSYIPGFFDITLIGDVSGSGPSNLPITTTFNLNLNEISSQNLTSGSVNLNDFKLINVLDPTLAQDAATKNYVDLLNVLGTTGEIISTPSLVFPTGPNEFTISLATTTVTPGSYTYASLTVDMFGRLTVASSGSNSITLIGPVSGSGILGSPITTSFNLNLNEISTLNLGTGNIDINNFRIINLADPINPLDAVNLQTLESFIPVDFNITLIGDVIGSGPSNLPIVTTIIKPLNTFTNYGNVNINNYKIINLADPINPLDAVNLQTLNYYVGGLKIDGFVVSGHPTGGVFVTSRGPRCVLNHIPATDNVDFGNFRIFNLADSAAQYDGVNYNTLWELINSDQFYAPHIIPEMQILGPLQQFKFDINYSGFQLSNSFVPTNLINSETKLEFSNSNLSGYRVRQETTPSSDAGNLYFEQFVNAEPDGVRFFGIDDALQETVFYKDASMGNNSLRDVAEMPEVLDEASENNAVSFAFLFKLLNDEVI